jgi:hypothetical protein
MALLMSSLTSLARLVLSCGSTRSCQAAFRSVTFREWHSPLEPIDTRLSCCQSTRYRFCATGFQETLANGMPLSPRRRSAVHSRGFSPENTGLAAGRAQVILIRECPIDSWKKTGGIKCVPLKVLF